MAGLDLPETLTPEQVDKLGGQDVPETLTPEQMAKLEGAESERPEWLTPGTPGTFRKLSGETVPNVSAADIAPLHQKLPAPSVADALGTSSGAFVDRYTLGGYGALLRGLGKAEQKTGIDIGAGRQLENIERFRGEHPLVSGLTEAPAYVAEGPIALLGSAGARVAEKGAEIAPRLLGGPIRQAAVSGAVGTGLMGAAEAAHEGRSPADIAKRAGTSAVLGGLVGAGAEGVATVVDQAASKAAAGARDRIRKWVQSDIVGEKPGASTATARKLLADDAEDVADVVTRDPNLETALRRAGRQDPERITAAQAEVEARLEPTRDARPKLYAELDQTLGGGVRSGDYVEHLEKAKAGLEATGKGADREVAKQIQDRIDIIKSSRDWGGGSQVFDPNAEIGGERAGTLVSVLEKSKARARDPEALEREIQRIRAETSKPGYDPDTVVPSERVRDNVTDLQTTAYNAYGGINGTNAFNRARETAGHAEDFLDGLKQRAAATNPDLIAKLNEHDKTVSALLRIKQVLEQRANKAVQAEQAAMGQSIFGRGLHALKKEGSLPVRLATAGAAAAMGHPHVAAAMALPEAARAAIAGRRALDYKLRNISESGTSYADAVLENMRRGLPLSAAVEAASERAAGARQEE